MGAGMRATSGHFAPATLGIALFGTARIGTRGFDLVVFELTDESLASAPREPPR
jgi:hypothetical protein